MLSSRLSLRAAVFGRSLSTTAARNAELEVTEAAPHVFHVEMNRPERRNTFTLELWKEFKRVFDELAVNSRCRAIVLSGRGKLFCAGIDLQMGAAGILSIINDENMDISRKGRKMRELITTCQDGFTAIEQCPKPVIAAIHAHCVGAGIDLITACDIRYASHDAVFSIKEVDIGMAADVGTLNRIQKVVGNDSLTRELAYTGRDFTSDEALSYGLVSSVCVNQKETIEKALTTASRIAEKGPIGVQGTKITLNHARDHTVAESLEFIKIWNQSQLLSEDLVKGAMAMMKKEKPTFNDV